MKLKMIMTVMTPKPSNDTHVPTTTENFDGLFHKLDGRLIKRAFNLGIYFSSSLTKIFNFKKEIDRMIDHGENVLGGIKQQNDMLKTIKRKIFNVANQLGLSNTLIRMIERRNTSDKYVLYGGMIITCIILFLAIRYLI